MINRKKVFVVIDGNSVVHRGFHAMPALTNKRGEAVGAIYGFMLALLKTIEDFQPDYLAVCFDTKAPTFRHIEFKEYKAQRPATDEKLIPQLKAVQDLLVVLKIAVFALEGFEADDLIATVVRSAQKDPQSRETDFYVLTGDYDSLQLVDDRIKAFIINRGVKNAVLYDRAKVKESFGVFPEQIPALKALAGDSSDNIPGAPGIGKSGAIEILQKYGSLENFYKAAAGSEGSALLGDGVRGQKAKDILLDNKEKILHFQKLTTMRDDAPIAAGFKDCVFNGFDGRASGALLDLGLASLAKRLPQSEEKTSRNGKLF